MRMAQQRKIFCWSAPTSSVQCSATMATAYSTDLFGAVASIRFLAIENMTPHFSAHLLWQNGGWFRMPLGTEVGLGPSDIVLGETQLLPKKRGTAAGSPPLFAVFGRCLLWPNGWIDQDTTWYGGTPRPRRRGTQLALPLHAKGHSSQPPHVSTH